jgi:U3 small nucleolar RNA-associated protein 10
MPIFTFMGNTILRKGDDYSAHVIDQTVSRVVPPLVASLKKTSRRVVTGVSPLLFSFTAAFEHIPSHRRLGLFQHVVQMIGPEDCLFAVVIMIVDRYPTDNRARHFVTDLLNMFGPDVELRVLNQYVDLVADIYRPRRGLSDDILNLKEKSAEQVGAISDNLLDALRELLNGLTFRTRIVKSFHHEHSLFEIQQAVFSELMKAAIQLTQQLKDTACADASSKVLSSVLGILPTVDLVLCAEMLLDHSSDDIRDIVIDSVGSQIRRVKHGDAQSTAALLNFIPRITAVIISEKDPLQRYSAITCIQQISERFGKKEPTKVLPATTVIASDRGLGSSNNRVEIVSLLTLASMVDVLRDDMIPLVPQMLAQTFALLKQSIDVDTSDVVLHNACFGLINSVVGRLPYLMTGDHLDGALRLAQSSTTKSVDGGRVSREQFYVGLSQKISAAEMFAALERTYEWARSEQNFEVSV